MKKCALCEGELKPVLYCKGCHILHAPSSYNAVCVVCGVETEKIFVCSECKLLFKSEEGINEVICNERI